MPRPYTWTCQANWIKLIAVLFSFQFSDPQYGEWFGYLNQKGEVTHTFKGGPFKGKFDCINSLSNKAHEQNAHDQVAVGFSLASDWLITLGLLFEPIIGKIWIRAKWPIRMAHTSSFCSMKRLGVFLLLPRWDASPWFAWFPPSIKFTSTHSFTWVERGTVRVKCLAHEHSTMSLARARTWTAQSQVKRTRNEATAPLLKFIHWRTYHETFQVCCDHWNERNVSVYNN